MTREKYIVFLVPSTSYALRGEKVLRDKDIPCKLIPVPRQLSSDCGICIRITPPDKERAVQALGAAKLPMEGIHIL